MLARIKTAIGDRTNRPGWRHGGQEELDDDRQDEQALPGEELAKDTTSSDTASLASTASHAPSDMPELKPTSTHAAEAVGGDSASSRRSSQGSETEHQDVSYASAWHFQQCGMTPSTVGRIERLLTTFFADASVTRVTSKTSQKPTSSQP